MFRKNFCFFTIHYNPSFVKISQLETLEVMLVYSHSYWLAIFCTTNNQPRAGKGEVAKYILSYLIRQHFLLILGYCLLIHIIIEASGYLIKYVIFLSTLQVDNYTGYVSQIRNQGTRFDRLFISCRLMEWFNRLYWNFWALSFFTPFSPSLSLSLSLSSCRLYIFLMKW